MTSQGGGEREMTELSGWVVVTPMGYPLLGTFDADKNYCETKFMRKRPGRFFRRRYWMDYYLWTGYRFERVILIKVQP